MGGYLNRSIRCFRTFGTPNAPTARPSPLRPVHTRPSILRVYVYSLFGLLCFSGELRFL